MSTAKKPLGSKSTQLPKTPKLKKPLKKKPSKAADDKPPSSSKNKPSKKSSPGVIASILEFLQAASESNPLSKDALLKRLKERFPNREEPSMLRTINCQVPKRLEKEKGVRIQKSNDGFWI